MKSELRNLVNDAVSSLRDLVSGSSGTLATGEPLKKGHNTYDAVVRLLNALNLSTFPDDGKRLWNKVLRLSRNVKLNPKESREWEAQWEMIETAVLDFEQWLKNQYDPVAEWSARIPPKKLRSILDISQSTLTRRIADGTYRKHPSSSTKMISIDLRDLSPDERKKLETE